MDDTIQPQQFNVPKNKRTFPRLFKYIGFGGLEIIFVCILLISILLLLNFLGFLQLSKLSSSLSFLPTLKQPSPTSVVQNLVVVKNDNIKNELIAYMQKTLKHQYIPSQTNNVPLYYESDTETYKIIWNKTSKYPEIDAGLNLEKDKKTTQYMFLSVYLDTIKTDTTATSSSSAAVSSSSAQQAQNTYLIQQQNSSPWYCQNGKCQNFSFTPNVKSGVMLILNQMNEKPFTIVPTLRTWYVTKTSSLFSKIEKP